MAALSFPYRCWYNAGSYFLFEEIIAIEQNLILSEAEFDEFQRYCREKGFDLSYYVFYFSNEISGSKRAIERHQFDEPKVIKLIKHGFEFIGIPYTVAEWQQDKWRSQFAEIKEAVLKKQIKVAARAGAKQKVMQ